ncbi:MAG: hypothetical protein U9Q29_02790 [Campylobacterota bacterium]|nr:hypothetical protein [Campylobacterota bacterium]
MIVEELVALLGFEYDDADVKKFDQGMTDAKKILVSVGVAAVATAGAIFTFTKSIAETNDALGKQAQTLGLATAELQAWNFAAELGGSSADSMTSSLENLNRVASEASRGMGAGVEVFGMLGMSATGANGQIKSSSQLLEEVADRVSQLDSQAQKLEFLNKIGISSDLLLTLDQGSEALRKQRLEAKRLGFTLSETAAKDAADFNDEMLRINKIVSGVSNSIGQELMTEITPMLTAFKKWFIANKKIIQQNLKGFLEETIKVLKGIGTIAKRLWNTINSLAKAFGGWEKSIMAVGTALLLLNAKALLLPIVLIAVGAAIFLLIEDIVKYFQGVDSAIGDLVEKFPLVGDALEVLRQWLSKSAEGWDLLFTKGDDALKGLMIVLQNLGNTIMKYVMKPIDAIKNAFDYISNIKISNPFDEISNPFTDMKISNPFENGGILDFLNPMQNYTPLQTQAITSNNQTVSSSISNSYEINVTGVSGDSANIGTTVRKEIEKINAQTYKQTSKDLKSGVVR